MGKMPGELVSKQMRQDMILEIVKARRVHNQLELIKLLEERGISATQSSVSRDIHELSIAKVDSRYVVAVLPVQDDTQDQFVASDDSDSLVRALSPAGPSVLVVKTEIGTANNISASIDKAHWPEVLGTIAGEDTIFIATVGKREQLRLITRLQEFMSASDPMVVVDNNTISPSHIEQDRMAPSPFGLLS
ncbi:MAG: transcriptional regulator of arginine metabolism [Planctomycetota bacterium]|jgi:transcriptional regulator of arginine metabolism